MTLDEVDPGALDELLPDLEDLAHDLGKYLCFEATFVGPDAPTPDLRRALLADVRATRRQGDRTLDAWAVWAALRPAELAEDPVDPDVSAVDGALAALAEIDLDAADRDGLLAAAALARAVRTATRRLVARARTRLDETGTGGDPLDDDVLLP